jgi:hypothetical protein
VGLGGRHPDTGTASQRSGTLITHVRFQKETLAIGSLMVPVILATFRTFLMTALGFAQLLLAGLLLAGIAAVALAPVTGPANMKNHPAEGPATDLLPQRNFGGRTHWHPKKTGQPMRGNGMIEPRLVKLLSWACPNEKPRLLATTGAAFLQRIPILPDSSFSPNACGDDIEYLFLFPNRDSF